MCEVVLVPCVVGAVVAVAVMRVLWFVCDMSILSDSWSVSLILSTPSSEVCIVQHHTTASISVNN